MEKIRIIHDTAGRTLAVWLDEPSREAICEGTADEVVLMKDAQGRVIGLEILCFRPPKRAGRLGVEVRPVSASSASE